MSTKEEKQKKWENYWYYYKWHTIVGIVALLVIVYTVYDKVTYIKPDFEIDAVTDCGFSYNSADTIANSLASSGALDDINGDGKIKASVSYYTAGYSGEASKQADPSMMQIVQLRMAVGESPIILTDSTVAKVYEDQGVFADITDLADRLGIANEDRLASKDGKVIGINIAESAAFADTGIQTGELYLTLRNPTNDIKKNKKAMKEFENAEKIAEYLIKG